MKVRLQIRDDFVYQYFIPRKIIRFFMQNKNLFFVFIVITIHCEVNVRIIRYMMRLAQGLAYEYLLIITPNSDYRNLIITVWVMNYVPLN